MVKNSVIELNDYYQYHNFLQGTMICRLSLLSISTFWDSYYYYRIGFFQGISISYRSNIFESLLLYSVSCTNCEVFDKKRTTGRLHFMSLVLFRYDMVPCRT